MDLSDSLPFTNWNLCPFYTCTKKKKKKYFKAATDIYMYIITYFDRYLAKNKWLKFSL